MIISLILNSSVCIISFKDYTLSDLANAQTALQASYAIGTRILGSVSLLDYL